MKNHHFTLNTGLFLVGLFTASLLVSGCGGPPGNNPLVDASRAAYDAAARNPVVVSNAPEVLKEAQADLLRSESLLSSGADQEVVEHYAYLAKQNVAIAQETTRLKLAEESIEQAEAERTAVQLEARTAEANVSRLEAEQKTAEAKASMELAAKNADETRRALARAEELADRITEMEAEQTARGLVLTLGDVLFDVGKSELKAGGNRAIDELSTFLEEYPNRNVLIEGFTDNTGSVELNENLSSRRSGAVRAALIARGISDSRIQTRGYGESFPKAGNDTAAGRQQNRRVEVVISDDSGKIPNRTD